MILAKIEDAIPLIVICLGIATVGSGLGILWYRSMSPSSFDRDSALFIVKLFFGIAIAGIVLGIVLKG